MTDNRTTRPWWAARYTLRGWFRGALSVLLVGTLCVCITACVAATLFWSIEINSTLLAVIAIIAQPAGAAVQHYLGRDSDGGDDGSN